jgi:hypothetical protein
MGAIVPVDDVAAQFHPSPRLAGREVGAAECSVEVARHPVVAPTGDGEPGGLGEAEGVLTPARREAEGGDGVQLSQPRVLPGSGRLEEFLGPPHRFVSHQPETEKRRAERNGSGRVEVAAVGRPPEGAAQVGDLGGEPCIGFWLAWTVPEGEHVGFPRGEVVRVRGACVVLLACGDEVFLGELANGLQHRIPGGRRRPVGHQERLAHQRVEDVQRGEFVIPSRHRKRARQVESAGEDRTPLQQRPFRVVEQVVGPLDRVTQRLVTLESAVRADQQPEPVVEAIPKFGDVHGLHPGRRQLDGQRDPVEAPTDLGDRFGGIGERDPGRHGLGAFDEEARRGGFDVESR